MLQILKSQDAGEDLPALRTTPFQEGEDDEGIVLGIVMVG